jgi:hypothetical protein
MERLDKGRLDLAVALGLTARGDAQPIATLPLAWIGPSEGRLPWRAG